jgi:hypothetical protein
MAKVKAVSVPATALTEAVDPQAALIAILDALWAVPFAALMRWTVVKPVREGALMVGPVARTTPPAVPVVPFDRSPAATCVHVSAVAAVPVPRDLRYFGVSKELPARRVPTPDVPPVIRSPRVVIGDRALKPAFAVVCPVPPEPTPMVPVNVAAVTGAIPPE